ncbi:hypothetical protein OE749_17590 [Aestuariibacter sp. AA17]|uniref:Endonuclease/exonuclease/phosphatase domain-containing protein n=1 Tax=Fluctibacter corallii TaxID=2984329 RepID=A0ABT3ACZ8_9ALTE|nr:endonuclease/exonuclease/phosphatase family protein [Aestuariibacter sp. AA17]MCV2886513.1 hypothetical protein [Aestuariibacter sp. AA17]
MKKVSLALFTLCATVSSPSYADVDPWVVAADIPGLITDLWPNGTRGSKGESFEHPSTSNNLSGEFNVVTYNIDGFPESIGGTSNAAFKKLIKILNNQPYDVVNMQELFIEDKHDHIRDHMDTAAFPYRSKHHRGTRTSFGSGLLRVSKLPFDKNDGFDREDFTDCHDIDCYTEKGFTFQRHWLNSEVSVDIYNMHNDAGRQNGDVRAKRAAMRQLANYINIHSANSMVIVAGDYNLGWHDETKPNSDEFLNIVTEFLASTGLSFSCQITHGGAYNSSLDGCKYHFQTPDRIAFKGSNHYNLTPTQLTLEEGIFVKDNGNEISDHLPLKAEFTWSRK